MDQLNSQHPSRSYANGNGPADTSFGDWVGVPAHWWLIA